MRSIFPFFLCLFAIASIQSCSDGSDFRPVDCPITDPDNPGNRLVVIGHSYPAGFLDGNVFPESQRWVYPSYIAERLGATYSAPELQLGMATTGISTPDFRSFFSATGFVMSPYYGIFDLPAFDTKARPEEHHTNLAVPGALLSQVLQFDFSSRDACSPDDLSCLFHFAANGDPYSGIVNPTGVWPSQLDIAVYLKPRWILINIGGNDLNSLVNPDLFENDFRTMLNRLTRCNSDTLIVIANVEYDPNVPGYVTADEADRLFGLTQGTSSLAYYEAIGIVPEPGDRFSLIRFTSFLADLSPTPPPLVTVAEQNILEEYKEAYNHSIHYLAQEFGALHWDNDEALHELLDDGLEVSIDGTNYHLTNDYGGGLWSFDGNHVGKTVHATAANSIIKRMNSEAREKNGATVEMPLVNVDAVACTDLHVRRALGLNQDPEEFSCPGLSVD